MESKLPTTVWFGCFSCFEFLNPEFGSPHSRHLESRLSGRGRKSSWTLLLVYIILSGLLGGSQCLNECETYLVRDGQQHPVQLLHQLFEGGSLGWNSLPALAHHHVATVGEKKNNTTCTKNYFYNYLQSSALQQMLLLRVWFNPTATAK